MTENPVIRILGKVIERFVIVGFLDRNCTGTSPRSAFGGNSHRSKWLIGGFCWGSGSQKLANQPPCALCNKNREHDFDKD
jgi:hypothetical protein